MITRRFRIFSILLLITCVLSSDLMAQKKKEPINRILFIFDASQSMLSRWQSGRKIDIAKNLLSNMLDSLQNIENLEIALRVYGHKSPYPPKDCDDSYLEVNFLKADKAAGMIKKRLSVIKSRGTTPIARSLEEGAKDFPDSFSRNIVILITDGKEECDMDPCAVSRMYQRNGIILKPFVIGIGLDKDWKESFDCVGRFFDASRESDFSNILNIVISHVVDNTTAQINLLDENNNPTETNINVTFYDDFTGISKYNYVHTLDNFGNPDTIVIDPVLSYKVVAHTIPPVTLENIIIEPGHHTIIPLKTPQGKLEIKMNSRTDYQYIIRPSGVDSILHVQNTNEIAEYIVGFYDIELLTLPRRRFKNVEILPNQTTEYHVQAPGLANIILPSKGYGGIYLMENNELQQIYRFRGDKKEERISLLPGKYKVVFRSVSAGSALYTAEKQFSIISGKSKLVKF